MTWTHSGSRAWGAGPHFDVSREIGGEGAGGEGQGEGCPDNLLSHHRLPGAKTPACPLPSVTAPSWAL